MQIQMEGDARTESETITKNTVSAKISSVGNSGKLLWQVQF